MGQLFCWKMTSQDCYSNTNLHFYLKWNIRNIKRRQISNIQKVQWIDPVHLFEDRTKLKIRSEIKPPFVASIDFLAPQGEWPLVSSSWDLGGLYLLQKYYMFDEKNGPICKSERISKSIFDRVAKFQRNVQKTGLFCGLFLLLQKVNLWKIPFEISKPTT